MKIPIVVPLEDLSDDPANNYLQYLFMFSIRDGTTDMLFYFGKDNIQIYRNHPRIPTVILPSHLIPKEVMEFSRAMSEGIVKRDIPEGFSAEMPTPLFVKDGLEKSFRDIYRLGSLEELSDHSSLRDIKFGDTNLVTGISKLPEQEGKGYRIHINY